MADDGRRDLAINMLNEWRHTAESSEWFRKYAEGRNNSYLQVIADTMAREVDSLREEILMLMGVDDTPAAALELDDPGAMLVEQAELEGGHRDDDDDEPEVDPDPRDTEGDLRFHDPEGKA